ncbi:MAG: hypothetical protein IJ220_01590 [Clostridia bacterium]|nr:hypothetical protein [Clostridia bacterium]
MTKRIIYCMTTIVYELVKMKKMEVMFLNNASTILKEMDMLMWLGLREDLQ